MQGPEAPVPLGITEAEQQRGDDRPQREGAQVEYEGPQAPEVATVHWRSRRAARRAASGGKTRSGSSRRQRIRCTASSAMRSYAAQ